MRQITIDDLREQVQHGRPQRAGQLAAAEAVLRDHPDAILIEVADEGTGERFGHAACRRGRAVKLGSSGWQPRGGRCGAYQLWATWA